MNKLCLSCNVSSVSKIFYGEAIRSKSLNQELQIVQNRVFHVIFGFGISLRQLGVLFQLQLKPGSTEALKFLTIVQCTKGNQLSYFELNFIPKKHMLFCLQTKQK